MFIAEGTMRPVTNAIPAASYPVLRPPSDSQFAPPGSVGTNYLINPNHGATPNPTPPTIQRGTLPVFRPMYMWGGWGGRAVAWIRRWR